MSCDMRFDLKDALERQNCLQSDIAELSEKIKEFKHVPRSMSEKKLLCFLNACNGIDDAAKVISTYYEVRQTHPSIFSNRDPLSGGIQQCLNNQYYVHMPRTPSGHSLIYHCLSNSIASNYHFDEACKTFFMTIDSLFCTQGPSNGLIIIFDMTFVGYRHLFRPSVEGVRVFCRYLQEALPGRLHAIHVLNCVSFFEVVMSIVRPFIRADIFKKLHIHPCGIDYKTLQEDWNIPAECLPSNLCGQLDSIDELHKNHSELLVDLREYFIADEKEANKPAQ